MNARLTLFSISSSDLSIDPYEVEDYLNRTVDDEKSIRIVNEGDLDFWMLPLDEMDQEMEAQEWNRTAEVDSSPYWTHPFYEDDISATGRLSRSRRGPFVGQGTKDNSIMDWRYGAIQPIPDHFVRSTASAQSLLSLRLYFYMALGVGVSDRADQDSLDERIKENLNPDTDYSTTDGEESLYYSVDSRSFGGSNDDDEESERESAWDDIDVESDDDYFEDCSGVPVLTRIDPNTL
ncbi:uncharacterized protein RJT20DRAFT_127156 [Scheffersomyces xylosifermentans]|uniref:uncharacterized protein n=1 Tax=Scheffersomyces xylosifermentans TaxID=1304137 RepID=UPI00315C6240